MKHERRVVGHVSGWQEQMDTCVCGKPWPCPELLTSNLRSLMEKLCEYLDGYAEQDEGNGHYQAAIGTRKLVAEARAALRLNS